MFLKINQHAAVESLLFGEAVGLREAFALVMNHCRNRQINNLTPRFGHGFAHFHVFPPQPVVLIPSANLVHQLMPREDESAHDLFNVLLLRVIEIFAQVALQAR